ncbi:MAG TPA: DUF3616 domain-containing protein, partial [Blastocatellia bacterium]|nr:DUF3616 domain-containing protein [Blastocatellia bacterium]
DPVEITSESKPVVSETEQKATLRIILPTGDVFDREINRTETQMGKGPRNDIVVADPAVSASHALIKVEGNVYTVSDLGSRNGTYLNGEKIDGPRNLNHGDVIGLGLSKLTFRLSDYSETGAVLISDLAEAVKPRVIPSLTEESLAEAVVTAGLVSKAQVDKLLKGDAAGRRLSRGLIEEKLVTEERLRDLMSKTFDIETVDLNGAEVEEALTAKFPSRLARKHQIIPLSMASNKLVLAVADPTNSAAIADVRRELKLEADMRLATPSEILQQIYKIYAPRLIGVQPSGERLECIINQKEIEIGKAAHNTIVLTDITVSNTHAVILARDGGYSIVDLGSRNGTFVNGDRLGSQARTLRHGDSIQLGQTVLTFRNPQETTENITAVLSQNVLEEIRKRAESQAEEQAPTKSAGKTKSKTEDVEVVTPAALPAAAPAAPAPLIEQKAEEKPHKSADEPQPDGEKKKKKKKKGEQERLKAAYIGAVSRVIAQIIGPLALILVTVYIIQRPQTTAPTQPAAPSGPAGRAVERSRFATPGAATAFTGGLFEPSGVIQVPDSNNVFFVSDGKKDAVFLVPLDGSGNQAGDIRPVALGTKIADPEAITYGGGYFYVVGSQSDATWAEQNAIVRFKYDPTTQAITGQAEVIADLRGWLLENVPELSAEGSKAGIEGGLNVEGMAWDPTHERLILGLRSPFVDGGALLVALKVRDSFTREALALADPGVIKIPLEGLGVRDIHFDTRLKSFLILAGAAENQKRSEFKLWEWSGDTEQANVAARPREGAALDQNLKPEGIAHVRVGGRDFIFIACDANRYFKIDYATAE